MLRWVFPRVTSGRLFLRTKSAEPGDARIVSVRSQHRCPPASFASVLWRGIRGAVGSPRVLRRPQTVRVRNYTIVDGSGEAAQKRMSREPALSWLLGAQELLRETTGA